MTITAFDKPTLQALRADLDRALAEVAAKHGIKITTGTIRFDLATFSATMEADRWWSFPLWVALIIPLFVAWVAPVVIAFIMWSP